MPDHTSPPQCAEDRTPMVEIPLARAQEMRDEIELLEAALWLAAGDAVPHATGSAVDEYLEMARGNLEREADR